MTTKPQVINKTKIRARNILEHILFQKSIEYGGYDKIPPKEIQLALKITIATVIIFSAIEYMGETNSNETD